MEPEVYLRYTMAKPATLTTKVPEATAKLVRKRAKQLGITSSQFICQAVEEKLAPPSSVWAKELLKLPKVKGKSRTAEELEDAIVDAGVS